jgi:hypothetical protein
MNAINSIHRDLKTLRRYDATTLRLFEPEELDKLVFEAMTQRLKDAMTAR